MNRKVCADYPWSLRSMPFLIQWLCCVLSVAFWVASSLKIMFNLPSTKDHFSCETAFYCGIFSEVSLYISLTATNWKFCMHKAIYRSIIWGPKDDIEKHGFEPKTTVMFVSRVTNGSNNFKYEFLDPKFYGKHDLHVIVGQTIKICI